MYGFSVRKTKCLEEWYDSGKHVFFERTHPYQPHKKEWYFRNEHGSITTVLNLLTNTPIEHFVYDEQDREVEHFYFEDDGSLQFSFKTYYYPHGKMMVTNTGGVDYQKLHTTPEGYEIEMSETEFFAHLAIDAGEQAFTHGGKVYKIVEV